MTLKVLQSMYLLSWDSEVELVRVALPAEGVLPVSGGSRSSRLHIGCIHK